MALGIDDVERTSAVIRATGGTRLTYRRISGTENA